MELSQQLESHKYRYAFAYSSKTWLRLLLDRQRACFAYGAVLILVINVVEYGQ